MAIDLGVATVQIGADISQLSSGIDGAKVLMLGLAAGAVAAAGEALKMAGNFEQGVNRLKTGAGDTQDSFAALSKSILQISTDTGILTPALTQADYLILSSGQRGAQAFDTLAAAAKGAQIEQANVVDVSNVLSGAMHNFGTATFGANAYMNGLITAVSEGKVTLQQLAVAMGPIEPLARTLGISYNDLAAAMTTQTNAMIPADRAATGLRFMMQALENPTHKATAEMTKLGLSSLDVANEMKVSLPGALQMIIDAALKVGPEGSVPFNRAVGDMVGGVRGLTAFLALSGPHMADFVKNSDAIAASMKSGANDVNGWALAQSNLNIQADKAHAALDAMAITVGTQLMPYVEAFLKNEVVPGIQHFQEWASTSTGLRDAFKTVVDAMTTLITDTEAVVSWFGKAGPQGTVLKDVMLGVAGAIALVKFAALAGDLATLVGTTIPAALVKFGLLQGTLDATAAAEAAAATGADVAAASFTAMLGPLALVAAATFLVVQAYQAYTALPRVGPLTTTMPDGTKVDPYKDLGASSPYNLHMTQAGYDKLVEQARAAWQKQHDDQAAAEKKAVDDYNNYLANLQKNQQINDTIMIQNHLKTQQQHYATQQQYGALMLQEAQKIATGQQHIDDINHYNLLTGVAYYWTGEISATQTGTNTNYQIVKDGYQRSADTVASKMQQMKDAVDSKWSQINNDQTSAAAHSQEIIRSGFQSAADNAAAGMERMRAAVQSKWDQINAIMSHQITLDVNTVFTQSGAAPVVPFYGHAAGGTNLPPGMSWVGERGPEIIDVPGGSDIYSNSQSMSMMGGGNRGGGSGAAGGNQVIEVHNHMYWNGREITNLVMNEAVKTIRAVTRTRV